MNKNEYFMAIAIAVSKASKCLKKQVGAVIVDQDNKVVSTGYNGNPRGIDDTLFPMQINNVTMDYVIHAEHNAILFAKNCNSCKIFVTLSPCVKCAAFIIQAGITEVYYLEEYRCTNGLKFLNQNNILTKQIQIK